MDLLIAHPWPGNVRELENVVERAVALAPGSIVEVGDLPERVTGRSKAVQSSPPVRSRPTLDEMACQYVLRVLEQSKGNKSEAARVLGVPRRTLYRMLERYAEEGRISGVSHPSPSVH